MTEIYGTAYVETAKDKLKALMDALVTSMASGYDPAISYAYETHNVADLDLNAVTIGFGGCDPTPQANGGSGQTSLYLMNFTVRVHTAYDGSYFDRDKTARLLNSVTNKIQANLDLGDGYRVDGITNMMVGETFEESASIGGELTVTVWMPVLHSQE